MYISVFKKRLSATINGRTDNTMDNRKRTKSQTMINKPLHRKINIEQHAPN
jgi:hypothetical protein